MKAAILYLLLCMTFLNYASQFNVSTQAKTHKMPSEKILHDRFKALGDLDHFIEVTKIVERVADQELYPDDVVIAVALAMCTYTKHMNNATIISTIYLRKNLIIEALLKDFPEALKKLEANKLYTPKPSVRYPRKRKSDSTGFLP